MENALLPMALACGVALIVSGCSLAWVILFSQPAEYRRTVEQIAMRFAENSAAVETLEGHWKRYKIEMEALAESMDGVLESVERKRRQISGAASRLNPAAEAEPQTREEILTLARRKLYGGAA